MGHSYRNRGSSVSIVSDYRLDYQGSIPTERTDFSSSLCVQTGSRPTQPPIQWVAEVVSREYSVAGA
jgi:hypothetical protein